MMQRSAACDVQASGNNQLWRHHLDQTSSANSNSRVGPNDWGRNRTIVQPVSSARTVSHLWLRHSLSSPTNIAFKHCFQYQTGEGACSYCSTKSPMIESLCGLEPRWRNNQVANRGGRVEYTLCVLPTPAFIATASST